MGALLTRATIKQQAADQKGQSVFTLAQQHYALWSEAQQRDDLKRIFQRNADLSQPPTLAEEEYLNLIIAHYLVGWESAKTKNFPTLETLSKDAGDFFSRPLPRAIWEKTKETRDPRFVRFVERAVERGGPLSI
jgi:hypothetical protein